MIRILARYLLVGVGVIVLALLYGEPPRMARWGIIAYMAVTAFVVGYHWLGHRESRRRQKSRLLALQEQLENAQAESVATKRHWNALVNGLAIPFFLCKGDSYLVMANEAALRWFGFGRIENRSLLALTLSYELDRLLRKCIARKAQVTGEVHLNFPIERVALATIWPLPPPKVGGPALYAVTLADQTELNRLEQVRRDFVANVSHEFRTPLASVRALAETMLNDSEMPGSTRTRFLELMINETERLTRIADDLLTLSQAEMLPPRKELTDLAAVARIVLAQLEPEAQAKGVTLHDELPPELPMQASRDQMVQVVLNLVDNAIHYNRPDGHVYLRGRMQNEEVILEVEDTGIGILSEDAPRIFERFYRVDKTRSRDSGGTGLGLAIVKHIVEAHGGRVELESEFNRGSCFRVRLKRET